jgi:hypothetical protein
MRRSVVCLFLSRANDCSPLALQFLGAAFRLLLPQIGKALSVRDDLPLDGTVAPQALFVNVWQKKQIWQISLVALILKGLFPYIVRM